jgi:hypothetical protein
MGGGWWAGVCVWWVKQVGAQWPVDGALFRSEGGGGICAEGVGVCEDGETVSMGGGWRVWWMDPARRQGGKKSRGFEKAKGEPPIKAAGRVGKDGVVRPQPGLRGRVCGVWEKGTNEGTKRNQRISARRRRTPQRLPAALRGGGGGVQGA